MKRQIILLDAATPPSLLALLSDYVFQLQDQVLLVANTVDLAGNFLVLDIVTNDKDRKAWKVQIPAHFVLAIAPIHRESKTPIGFV